MGTKGVILIVEDLLEEKIGKFKQIIEIDGFTTKVTSTYKDSEKELIKLISSNQLDGIILDFSFPYDANDKSVVINDMPCGIKLLKDFEFKISLQGIPVVINTTGDNEYKRKYLESINHKNFPMYDVNNALTSLTNPSIEMVKDILKMFNVRYEKRNIDKSIKRDKSLKTGTSIIQGPDGNYHYSKYDGD